MTLEQFALSSGIRLTDGVVRIVDETSTWRDVEVCGVLLYVTVAGRRMCCTRDPDHAGPHGRKPRR